MYGPSRTILSARTAHAPAYAAVPYSRIPVAESVSRDNYSLVGIPPLPAVPARWTMRESAPAMCAGQPNVETTFTCDVCGESEVFTGNDVQSQKNRRTCSYACNRIAILDNAPSTLTNGI